MARESVRSEPSAAGADVIRLRERVPEPPSGLARLRWWGPGLLWAMSAVGSGSVLFTPRVGSEYGYTFLWLLWGVAFLMWVMIREAGRFAVATGRTLLDGFSTLPGPFNWALWVIFLPQLLAAVVGVAGLSALVGSALAAELPGSLLLWSLLVLTLAAVVVVGGGYPAVSRTALLLALVLVATTLVAAFVVYEPDGDAVAGIVPGIPSDLDVPFLLPWVGTILAGSMGIIWFSYWAARRGYGGETTQPAPVSERVERNRPGGDSGGRNREDRLADWFRTLSTTAGVGVVTGTSIITAFLVLGTELLGPQGIVPSGTDVATELTRLLADVWGRVGHWLMVAAIVIALGGSVLANQDGWSRSFADITLLLRRKRRSRGSPQEESWPGWIRRLVAWRRHRRVEPRRALKIAFAIVVTGVAPAVVVTLFRDPVAIMSVSGIVAAIHTPFIVFTTLAVNRRIPRPLRPGPVSSTLLAVAGIFYTVFAGLYFAELVGFL